MLTQAQMRVVGFRWISSRGQGACEACAALHGQEFYFEPGPGQRDAADAPEPPLHPYCKCRLDDIVRYEFNTENENEGTAHETHETTHPSIKPYMEDVTRNPVWRIIVRNRGTMVLTGHQYGESIAGKTGQTAGTPACRAPNPAKIAPLKIHLMQPVGHMIYVMTSTKKYTATKC